MVNGYKAVTLGHFAHFWGKNKGVEWELGEMRLKKVGSKPKWPSSFFGSGVLEAAGTLDKEWDGRPGGEATLRDQLDDSMYLFLLLPTMVQEAVDTTSSMGTMFSFSCFA